MTPSAVSFHQVSRTYGDITALDGITFEVPRGSIFGVVGTSGAGKSTLLRTVNGLEKPTSGTVTVLGNQPADLGRRDLRRLRRDVSMIFQHYNLLGSKTVAENVGMPLVLAGLKQGEISTKVTEALERVGLADRADHKPRQLSGGQRQRVGIARALVTDPKVLLCDEPTSALDPLTTSQILDLLLNINEELGITILIITHQMDVIARIADDVAVLEAGRLIEKGPVDQVFAHPQEALTRRFVGTVVPQRLPEHVLQEVRHGTGGVLVRLVHTGGAARTVMRDVEKQFGVDVALINASDTLLRHSTVGTMVLAISGPPEGVSHAMTWMNNQNGLSLEVLPE